MVFRTIPLKKALPSFSILPSELTYGITYRLLLYYFLNLPVGIVYFLLPYNFLNVPYGSIAYLLFP